MTATNVAFQRPPSNPIRIRQVCVIVDHTYNASMARKLKTQDVVRLTKTTRSRVEAWRRAGIVEVPQARPLLWDDEELLTAALVASFTDAGAPLDAVRGLQQLLRDAGSLDDLRAARLVVTLPTRADVEAAARDGIPYDTARLVRSDAALEELTRAAAQTLVVVDVGKILDVLERARAEDQSH